MKRTINILIVFTLALSLLSGCGNSSLPSQEDGPASDGSASQPQSESQSGPGGKAKLSMWFWGAPPNHQVALSELLVDKVNNDRYELLVEFRDGVDDNISVALAANEGPDLVYSGGPVFAKTYARAGKLADLTPYAEQYGWEDSIVDIIYEIGTLDGKLYSLGTSISWMGVFYNKGVLAENGWQEPTTIEEMEEIMRQAQEKGLYGNLGGNKGWKPVNNNYTTIFMNAIAGPDKIADCLAGKEKWNNPDMVAAINKSAEWYQSGFLGGDNYMDLNFDESVQLLSMGQAPFFVGPSPIFQWANNYFQGDLEGDLGFMPFPVANDQLSYPIYPVSTPACLSINAASSYKDECAEILNYIYSNEFMVEMTKRWPGYWAVPLKDLEIPEDEMGVLPQLYCDSLMDVHESIRSGNSGYIVAGYFPPGTTTALQDIDNVWLNTMTAEELLDRADAEFEKEMG